MNHKPILFIDWNGTLNNEHFFRSLDDETYQKIQIFLFGANKEVVTDWMKGKYTSEEVVSLVAHHLGIPFDDLWDVFVDDCATMTVDDEVITLIQQLRTSFVTILTTGNMDCFIRFTVPALKLNELFDEISSSHQEGVFKDENEGELFMRYASKYQTSISHAHLFDDSERVCQVFAALGGTSHLITPEYTLNRHLAALLVDE